MNEPAKVIPLNVAEISRYERFRLAEHKSVGAKAPDLDEMIKVCLEVRDYLEASAHAADAAYGGEFHTGIVRWCAVLQRQAEFDGVVEQRKNEIGPILRRRRA